MLRVFVALGKQLPKSKAMYEDTAEVARLLAKCNPTNARNYYIYLRHFKILQFG